MGAIAIRGAIPGRQEPKGGGFVRRGKARALPTMARMKRLLLSTSAGLLAAATWAGPTPGPVRAEIEALLGRLVASGCRFERNGQWHSGERARSHLLRKLRYIERRGTLQSTEQFIELAASRSSVSHQPYRVQCGDAAAQESEQWLKAQLAALRAPS